eukprot:6490943-Amphidinium_carterae.5
MRRWMPGSARIKVEEIHLRQLRSRLVCRDVKAQKSPADMSALFSATPPLEAVRALVSMMAWKRKNSRGEELVLAEHTCTAR